MEVCGKGTKINETHGNNRWIQQCNLCEFDSNRKIDYIHMNVFK